MCLLQNTPSQWSYNTSGSAAVRIGEEGRSSWCNRNGNEMRGGPSQPGLVTLCSHIKQSVLMAWVITAAGKEAHLLAAHATRSAWRHHAPAFSTVQRTPPARSMRWTTARARQTGNARDRRLSPGVNAVVAMPLRTSALRWQPCSNGLCATARRRRRPMCPIRVAPLCSTTDGHDNMGDSTVEIDAVDGVEPSANAGGVGKVSFDASAWSGLLEPLVQQVAVSLRERCDVRDGDSVLVLISGGSDSVALLLALHEATKTFHPPLHLEAAHFNHALRGQDSDADEAFVVDLASRLGIALHVRRWKGAEEGGTGGAGSGMQERARLWRRSEARDILDGIQEALSGGGEGERRGCVATAHHGDDQAETVLLKALRGAHITKMQGMAWKAGPFVRPLLGARKSDLVDFLHTRGQEWREDGSNQVAKYARNRVRLQLVPLLQDLAGGARALDARLDEFSRQSFLAREMVEQAALRWEQQHWVGRLVRPEEFPLLHFLRTGVQGGGDGGGVQQAPLPQLVREELLHRFVTANTGGTALPYAHLQLMLRQVDEGDRKWSLALGGGLCLRRVGDFLRIERVAETGRARNADPESSSLSHLAGHETNGATGTRPKDAADATMQWKLEVTPAHFTVGVDGRRLSEGGEGEVEQGMVLYNVRSGTQLHVRRRRDGDRFRPTWRDRPTKLKDFLRGQGVPLHRRDEVALICDQDDTVIAVYPSYPGFEFHQDDTGSDPVRVMVEGTPLCCPRPERAVVGVKGGGGGEVGAGTG